MIIQIATPGLVVLEAENGELTEEYEARETVLSVLEDRELGGWSSVEIEAYTYRGRRLLFAKPVRVFFPGFLARLLD